MGPGTVVGNAGDVFLVRGLARGWVAEGGMNKISETCVRNVLVGNAWDAFLVRAV